MRMLKLDLDTLAVESFHTADTRGRGGTVHAAQQHGFVAIGAHEECTVPSDGSMCPIMSCGSSCTPDTEPITGPVPTDPDQTAG
jgi:hypothetical protein